VSTWHFKKEDVETCMQRLLVLSVVFGTVKFNAAVTVPKFKRHLSAVFESIECRKTI